MDKTTIEQLNSAAMQITLHAGGLLEFACRSNQQIC